jgi:hypothetical protein
MRCLTRFLPRMGIFKMPKEDHNLGDSPYVCDQDVYKYKNFQSEVCRLFFSGQLWNYKAKSVFKNNFLVSSTYNVQVVITQQLKFTKITCIVSARKALRLTCFPGLAA